MASIICFILGMIGWTLAEYLLHRFLGHSFHLLPWRSRFYREHSRHHYLAYYFASKVDKLLSCLVFGPMVFLLFVWPLGVQLSVILTCGFLMMYLIYELIHFRLHTYAPPHAYASYMRAHHFYHHFNDEQTNHGVTTPIWDMVFGTYRKPQLIEVPEKFRLPWILSQNYQDKFGRRYRVV